MKGKRRYKKPSAQYSTIPLFEHNVVGVQAVQPPASLAYALRFKLNNGGEFMENAKSLAEHIREKYNISTDEIERLFKVQLDAEKVRLIKYIEDNAARSNTEFAIFFYDLDKADYYTEMKMRRRSDSVFHPKFKKRLNEFLRDEGFSIQTWAEHTSINLLYLGAK